MITQDKRNNIGMSVMRIQINTTSLDLDAKLIGYIFEDRSRNMMICP